MFSSDGRTWPEPLLPKRRILMQLDLSLTGRELDKRPSILARLNPEDRAALIKTLARLLVKTVRPQTKEPSHD
jgi:hypothetical protein